MSSVTESKSITRPRLWYLQGVRRILLISLVFCAPCVAQDRPLASLPYTPSLELGFLDRGADPCTDFYRYACGNWNHLNPIPPDQARWNVYAKLTDENQRFLWGILEQAAKPSDSRSASEQKIGDYFAACMDEAAIEKAGIAPLRPRLDQIEALHKLADLPPLLAKFHLELGNDNPVFQFGSSQDFADSDHVIAFALAGGLGLPDRDYYLKTDTKSRETRARYIEHVARMFRLLGDAPATARGEAQTVMAIEAALATSSLPRVDKRDPYKMFHKMSRVEFLKLAPSFGWSEYWTALGLAAPDELNVTEPAFYQALEKELHARSLPEWKTYLRWHLVHAEAPYLPAAFVQESFSFYQKHLRGVTALAPRWKRCVRGVDENLGEALGQVFVTRTFTPDTKQRALTMVRQIEQAMQADIEQLTWMGDQTKKQALDKLHSIVNKIGYPDHWRDYSAVRVSRDEYLGDVDRAVEFEAHRQLNKIGKPVDRTEWQMTPPTVNAYYDASMNDINFPAGVLQPPLFDPKMDDAPNYGNTGATIGHELTHGFDDEGRKFDGKGNLRDWWTKKDGEEFEERAACISNQYSKYTVIDDIKINGKLTLGEDAADLGGTILAWMAWKNATRGQDLKPTDGFTPEQRFFVGAAQWACGYERPESKRLHAITDEHSPDEYRINGVVSNMPEFSKAFACKQGDPMVREQVCRVW